MELVNFLYTSEQPKDPERLPEYYSVLKSSLEKLTLCIAPFTPHLAEEIWQNMFGYKKSIFLEKFPDFDPAYIEDSEVDIVIQINGKVRGKIRALADLSDEELITKAFAEPKVKEILQDKIVKKTVIVKKKLINIVV
jgi:leucyl-tRNA synthetase